MPHTMAESKKWQSSQASSIATKKPTLHRCRGLQRATTGRAFSLGENERRRDGDAGKGRKEVQPHQVLEAHFPGRHVYPTNLDEEKEAVQSHPCAASRQRSTARPHCPWRSIITDVSTVPGVAHNSNHYLMKIKMTPRTKKKSREKPKPKKTRKPTEEDKELYNRRVASKLSQQQTDTPPASAQTSHRAPQSTAEMATQQPNTPDTCTCAATTTQHPVDRRWQTIREAIAKGFAGF